MVTISHITNKIMDDNVFFQEALKMGIVNHTLLARYVKTDVERIYGKKVNTNSITRAIDMERLSITVTRLSVAKASTR